MPERSSSLGALRLAPRTDWPDRIATLAAWTTAAAITGVFIAIVGGIAWTALPQLSPAFLLDAPSDAGRAGGIGPILVSTLAILGVCLAATIPLGLGTAVYLAEFTRGGSLASRWLQRALDVLAGVPSIVFGLFGNAFFSLVLGMGFSILAGGLTLGCMVLPLFLRGAESSLRAVPDEYRRGAAALGLARPAVLRRILLPAAAPGIVAALVLAMGRALAETAALLFTSGYADRMPSSVMDSGRALSVHVYDLAMNVPDGGDRAHASALVLVLLLLAINTGAGWLGRRWHGRSAPAP
jgi:phosphate transport system permease protein